ncbi:MAG: hypothetical protein EPN45_20015 [Rhizobiaceae bacterium]|nr:MAG: hypothetical protein EPN45_20015 [Rhizobiaceae bacterium]
MSILAAAQFTVVDERGLLRLGLVLSPRSHLLLLRFGDFVDIILLGKRRRIHPVQLSGEDRRGRKEKYTQPRKGNITQIHDKNLV